MGGQLPQSRAGRCSRGLSQSASALPPRGARGRDVGGGLTAALPNALACWSRIARGLEGRQPAIFLDYDGTLAPIAARPDLAILPEATRDVVRRLAARHPVGILSSRGREDVTAMVGLDGILYAGSHGFDIAGLGLRLEVGPWLPAVVERAAMDLRKRFPDVPGVLIEPKRFAISVHFRLAYAADLPRIKKVVDEVAALHPELRKSPGKKVFELRPTLDWNKGRALLWMEEALHLDRSHTVPLYLGDDIADEDAFQALAGDPPGVGILVAAEPQPTAATYSLRDPEDVRVFLERLAEL